MCPTDSNHPNDPGRSEAKHPRPPEVTCVVCKKKFAAPRTTPVALIRPSLLERLRMDVPDLSADDRICDEDIGRYRSR
jgi:hypothetical protein